jgi:VWFA-related protein
MRTCCLALAAAALTLPPRATLHGQQSPTFSANAELVVLHVTVRDRKGAYVTGLRQEAFNVIEDGQAQTVRLFTDTDTPATIGLLIDSSGSMYQYRPITIAGATAFADASHS